MSKFCKYCGNENDGSACGCKDSASAAGSSDSRIPNSEFPPHYVPEGFIHDPNSSRYYKSTNGFDETGQHGIWITWFDPDKGEFKQNFTPDSPPPIDSSATPVPVGTTVPGRPRPPVSAPPPNNSEFPQPPEKKKSKLLMIGLPVLALAMAAVAAVFFLWGNSGDDINSDAETAFPSELTRSEWIVELYRAVTGHVPDWDNISDIGQSFADIPMEAQNYYEIQSAANFEWVFSELTDEVFYPDEMATREFVASTTVRAAGYLVANGRAGVVQPIDIFDSEDVYSALMAFNLGLLDADGNNACLPNETADSEFIEKCLAFVKTEVISISGAAEKTEIEFGSNVTDRRSEYMGRVTYNDDLATSILMPMSAVGFSVGDVVIFPESDLFPAGVARKIISITEQHDGNALIAAAEPEFEELFDRLDIVMNIDLAAEEYTVIEDIDYDSIPDTAFLRYENPDARQESKGQYRGYPENTGWLQPMHLHCCENPLFCQCQCADCNHCEFSEYPLYSLDSGLSVSNLLFTETNHVTETLSGSNTYKVNLKNGVPKKIGTVDFDVKFPESSFTYEVRFSNVLGFEIPLSVRYVLDYKVIVTFDASGKFSFPTSVNVMGPKYKEFFALNIEIPIIFAIEGKISVVAEGSGSITGEIGTSFVMPNPKMDSFDITKVEGHVKASVTSGLRLKILLVGVDLLGAGWTVTVTTDVRGVYYPEDGDYCCDVKISGSLNVYGNVLKGVFKELKDDLNEFKKKMLEEIKEGNDAFFEALDDELGEDFADGIDHIVDELENEFGKSRWWRRAGDYIKSNATRGVNWVRDYTMQQITRRVSTPIDRVISKISQMESAMSFDRKYPTPNFFDRHYEGQDFENLNRVPVCTKNFRIRVESPTTLEVGKSEAIVAHLENSVRNTSIVMPHSIMRIVDVDNPGIVSVSGGNIAGLKEGTARLRVIRLLTDLEGNVFASNIRAEFEVKVTLGDEEPEDDEPEDDEPDDEPDDERSGNLTIGLPYISSLNAYLYTDDTSAGEWLHMYIDITVVNNTGVDLTEVLGVLAIKILHNNNEWDYTPFNDAVRDIDTDSDLYWHGSFNFLQESHWGSHLLRAGSSYTLKSNMGGDMFSEDFEWGPMGPGGMGHTRYWRGGVDFEVVAEITRFNPGTRPDTQIEIPELLRTRVSESGSIGIP